MKTNEELLHPEFANFTEEDFLVIRDRILAVDKGNHQGWEEFHPDYLGALSGSILSCDCKLYPVWFEHGAYDSPHLAFSVWKPYTEETPGLTLWAEGESVVEFDDKLHISRKELEQMDYVTFCSTFADRLADFLDRQVTYGTIPASFIGEDTGFFKDIESLKKRGETWLIDPPRRTEHPKLSLEEKIHKGRQAFNQKMVDEALPKTDSREESHAALLAFAKKHDYVILKNPDACENPKIPQAVYLDTVEGHDFANELPKGVGCYPDMALAEGLTTIDDMDGLYPGVYIDTEENRKICQKALQKNPELRMEHHPEALNLEEVIKYYPKHPYSLQQTKEPSHIAEEAEHPLSSPEMEFCKAAKTFKTAMQIQGIPPKKNPKIHGENHP